MDILSIMCISKNIKERFYNYVDFAKGLRGSKQTGRSFHVTIIANKRKVISVGVNNYNRTVFSTSKFGKYKVYGPDVYIPNLHSEISALLKLGEEDCSNYDFYNIRIGNNDQLAPSTPCQNCMRILKGVGFNHIYYIDTNGKLIQI